MVSTIYLCLFKGRPEIASLQSGNANGWVRLPTLRSKMQSTTNPSFRTRRTSILRSGLLENVCHTATWEKPVFLTVITKRQDSALDYRLVLHLSLSIFLLWPLLSCCQIRFLTDYINLGCMESHENETLGTLTWLYICNNLTDILMGMNRVCPLRMDYISRHEKFYLKLDEVLVDIGYKRLSSDWAIWINPSSTGAIIAAHVDDMSACGTDSQLLEMKE